MPKPGPLYCVTDKELYDAVLSSKQHFSADSLRDLARTRGVIYSAADDRAELADRLSVMIFGSKEINAIQAEFETAGRGEKTTSFRLNTELTQADIKQVAEDYREAVGDQEKVVTYGVGSAGYAVDLEYTDIDFSKTRLRQRQTREAHIEFMIEEGHTIVTLPATEKARKTAEKLREQLCARKQTDIGLEEINFSGITDPKLRTTFFIKLISGLAGLTLQDVTRVKADREDTSNNNSENDEEAEKGDEANEEMLGIVRAMAIHGQSLLTSPEYQTMARRGFFITSITWSAKKTVSPYEIVEFDAEFDEPASGTGFKYGLRGWYTQRSGEYTKHPKPLPPEEKKGFLGVIERAAIGAFRAVQQELAAQNQDNGNPGGGT